MPGNPDDAFDQFVVSAKIMDAGKYRIPKDCIMRGKHYDPTRYALVIRPLKHYVWWSGVEGKKWHSLTCREDHKKAVQLLVGPLLIHPDDWVIQGYIPEEMLKFLWCILSSSIAKYWFKQVIPVDGVLRKKHLVDFPLAVNPVPGLELTTT